MRPLGALVAVAATAALLSACGDPGAGATTPMALTAPELAAAITEQTGIENVHCSPDEQKSEVHRFSCVAPGNSSGHPTWAVKITNTNVVASAHGAPAFVIAGG